MVPLLLTLAQILSPSGFPVQVRGGELAAAIRPTLLSSRSQGVVRIELTLDATGCVEGARILSGDAELRRAALAEAIDLRFQSGPAKVQVEIEVSGNQTAALEVPGEVQAEKLQGLLGLSYPPLARQARISGAVRFRVRIGRDGGVRAATFLAGHPLLAQAAYDALIQARYTPTLIKNQPVEVLTDVTITFELR